MDRLDTINAFVHVATLGSFVAASERLNLSPQLVSKYVANLEARLGCRLLNRTTRHVSLTEAGERYMLRAQQLLADMNDMESEISDLQIEAQGTLRINAPVSFAAKHLGKLLHEFQSANPKLHVDLQLNDRKVDIIEEGVDIALRIGELGDASFIAKKLAPVRLVLCASPHYLAKYGTPMKPQDLVKHRYMHYSYTAKQHTELAQWLAQARVEQFGNFTSNNGDVLTQTALCGGGIAIQPTFICGEHLATGDLIEVLHDYAPPPISLYAIYAHRQLLAGKVRCFLDHAATYYGNTPYWDNF